MIYTICPNYLSTYLYWFVLQMKELDYDSAGIRNLVTAGKSRALDKYEWACPLIRQVKNGKIVPSLTYQKYVGRLYDDVFKELR